LLLLPSHLLLLRLLLPQFLMGLLPQLSLGLLLAGLRLPLLLQKKGTGGVGLKIRATERHIILMLMLMLMLTSSTTRRDNSSSVSE